MDQLIGKQEGGNEERRFNLNFVCLKSNIRHDQVDRAYKKKRLKLNIVRQTYQINLTLFRGFVPLELTCNNKFAYNMSLLQFRHIPSQLVDTYPTSLYKNATMSHSRNEADIFY